MLLIWKFTIPLIVHCLIGPSVSQPVVTGFQSFAQCEQVRMASYPRAEPCEVDQ